MRSGWVLLGLGVGLVWAERALAGAYGDQNAFDRIEAARPVAAAIEIDGEDEDWAGIPAFSDPAGDAQGESARDIRSVSIAPTEDALLVRIATEAAPVADDLVYWLDIEYRGLTAVDLQIGLYPGFADILWTYPQGGTPFFQNWNDSELAIGDVVEARIPYAVLAPALPAEMAADLSGPSARPWLRVFAFSVHPTAFERLDQVAVASYRLKPTPYPLDPARPGPGGAAAEMTMPLDDLWYVFQGAFTLGSHAGAWAYDLLQIDAEFLDDNPHPGTSNSDYYAFGKPVRAPVSGPVRFARGTEPDQPPREFPPPGSFSNLVQIDASPERSVSLYHLRQGSVPVSAGQSATAGQVVGEVGNSAGYTPHLHLQAEAPAGGVDTQPIAVREVEVQLNLGDADPWERRLASWEIHEGFLVRPARALCGDLTLDRALDGADVALYRAALAGSTSLSTDAAARCSVIASAGPCTLVDAVVVRRQSAQPPLAPAIAQVCSAAVDP